MIVLPFTRASILPEAATVLQSRMPTWKARFRHRGHMVRARFEWPGVVSVYDDESGELLARSLFGKPAEADAQTIAIDLRNARP